MTENINKYEIITRLKELKKETYNAENYDISIQASKVLQTIYSNNVTKEYFEEKVNYFKKYKKTKEYEIITNKFDEYMREFANRLDFEPKYLYIDIFLLEYTLFRIALLKKIGIKLEEFYSDMITEHGIFWFYILFYKYIFYFIHKYTTFDEKFTDDFEKNFLHFIFDITEKNHKQCYDFYYLKLAENINNLKIDSIERQKYSLLKIAIFKVIGDIIAYLEEYNEDEKIIKEIEKIRNNNKTPLNDIQLELLYLRKNLSPNTYKVIAKKLNGKYNENSLKQIAHDINNILDSANIDEAIRLFEEQYFKL